MFDNSPLIEIIFLLVHRGYKPHFRKREWGYQGFSEEQYDAVKASLIKKRFLNSRGVMHREVAKALNEQYPEITQHAIQRLVKQYQQSNRVSFVAFVQQAECQIKAGV